MATDGGPRKVVSIGGVSLGSLDEHERLHAYCRRCQRYRSLDVRALRDRHGDLHLRALRRRSGRGSDRRSAPAGRRRRGLS